MDTLLTTEPKPELDLPSELQELLKRLPPNVTRRHGAKIISENLYAVSHRTLEGWSLPSRHVNGYAITPTRALLQEAYQILTPTNGGAHQNCGGGHEPR